MSQQLKTKEQMLQAFRREMPKTDSQSTTGMSISEEFPPTYDGGNTLVIQPGATVKRLQELRAQAGNANCAVKQEQGAEAPTKKKRRKRASEAVEEILESKPAINITVTVPNFGVIPSQYKHAYTGKGVLVLGMSELSYEPAVATTQVSFSIKPDALFVNTGYSFVDSSGVRNLILLEVPEDDGQEEQ